MLILIIFFIAFWIFIPGGGLGTKNCTLQLNQEGETIFFAHRGIMNYYTENSFEGIMKAKELGFKAVEIDLRKTKDDTLFLFHDSDYSRLLGINKSVNDLTYNQIKDKELLFHKETSGQKILTFDRYLTLFKDDFITYLDIKKDEIPDRFKLADLIVNAIRNRSAQNSVIVANSDIVFLGYIEYYYPEINTVLEGFNKGKEWTYTIMPKNFTPDFFASKSSEVDKNHIDWLIKKNLISKRIVYGADSANIDLIIESGIKNMIIDYDSTIHDKIMQEVL